jgi:hypothetical protein
LYDQWQEELQPLVRFRVTISIISGGVPFGGGRLLHVAGWAIIDIAVEGVIRAIGDDRGGISSSGSRVSGRAG